MPVCVFVFVDPCVCIFVFFQGESLCNSVCVLCCVCVMLCYVSACLFRVVCVGPSSVYLHHCGSVGRLPVRLVLGPGSGSEVLLSIRTFLLLYFQIKNS